MVWYLIFCSAVNSGVVCIAPTPMPSKEACLFMGKQMKATLKMERSYSDNGSYKCVGVKK